MSKRNKPVEHEDRVLSEMLYEKWEKSGLSQTVWAERLGIKAGKTHLSYLFNGHRGLSFWKAMRFIKAAGLKLRDIEKRLGKK